MHNEVSSAQVVNKAFLSLRLCDCCISSYFIKDQRLIDYLIDHFIRCQNNVSYSFFCSHFSPRKNCRNTAGALGLHMWLWCQRKKEVM